MIASAPTTLTKDKFLSTIHSSNSTGAVASGSLPSRKIGRLGDSQSQATARKVLETEAIAFHEEAVPPLSPPLVDDDHVDGHVMET